MEFISMAKKCYVSLIYHGLSHTNASRKVCSLHYTYICSIMQAKKVQFMDTDRARCARMIPYTTINGNGPAVHTFFLNYYKYDNSHAY